LKQSPLIRRPRRSIRSDITQKIQNAKRLSPFQSEKKERWAWYAYDIGNSAYAAVVILAIYAAYFKGHVVGGAEGSRLWSISVGIAMLVVAITSPVLGVIADFSGSKKRFLLFYTIVAVIATGLLFFVNEKKVRAVES
jgi:UMF1 family MFS transporter